ncbi:MAG: methyltransferase, partial [Thermicanus sp.]|nr:methyltransferase [Thermicanus sp.]
GKEVVFRFYEEAYERLKDGGRFWVVIQKKQGAESTEKKLKGLFSRVERVAQAKGYRVYRAEKNSVEE